MDIDDINLKSYGLTAELERKASEYTNLFVCRVTEQHRDLYKVVGVKGEIDAFVSGKFAYDVVDQVDFPSVGDWVMVDRCHDNLGNAVIHHVLARKGVLTRKSAGITSTGQVIAANIDTIFICMSLNDDFNIRRIERYLTLAWESNAAAVIVLTKSDLCEDLDDKLSELTTVSVGVDVVVCSSESGDGYDNISSYISDGKTTAFIGSSGVGKSTLVNGLMGQQFMLTNEIRQDDSKGKHTTTHRQLLLLPNGGIVIDTPGMRELQLSGEDVSRTFKDIEDLARSCKFRDCSHKLEPGCVIREAVKNGSLSQSRFESYKKLQREAYYFEIRQRQLENQKIKNVSGNKKDRNYKNKKERR